MPVEAKEKPVDYPDAPDASDLPKFDLGIQEDHKTNLHSQISAYLLLILILTIVIAYYFLA